MKSPVKARDSAGCSLAYSKPAREARLDEKTPLREIYVEHGPELRRHLHRMVQDTDAADDLLHDTFCKLIRDHERTEGRRRPRAYIFRIATNLALDFLRRSKRSKNIFEAHPAENVGSGSPGPERIVESRIELEHLIKMLSRLPQRTRDILLLHRFDNMTYSEIAASLNVSTRTVERHMRVAMEGLQEIFGDGGW